MTKTTFPLNIYPAIVSTPEGQFRGVRLDMTRNDETGLVTARIYIKDSGVLKLASTFTGVFTGNKFRAKIQTESASWSFTRGGSCGCGGSWLRLPIPELTEVGA